MTNKSHLGYVPYLDGLRALAIWLVMGFHGLDPVSNRVALFLNGWVGVDIFFVLSGFLITSLLIQERDAFGAFSFKGFYLRRSLRIVPAYVVFLAVMLALFGRQILDAVLVSGAYLSDYDQALGFGLIHRAEQIQGVVLRHTWSLSVEEQFYLLWPFLLFLTGRRALAVACGIIAIVPAWRTLLLFFGDGRNDRLYTAFDTRLDVLMVGCVAALAWGSPVGRERVRKVLSRSWTPIAFGVGLLCMAHVMHMVDGHASQASIAFWVCKLPLYAILAGLLILAMLVHPNSIVARAFSNKVLVWIGKLSYSLYLWHHFAIQQADGLRPFIQGLLYGLPYDRYLTALATGAVGIAFALALAMTSYYVVERPFLRLKKLTERIPAPSPSPAGAA